MVSFNEAGHKIARRLLTIETDQGGSEKKTSPVHHEDSDSRSIRS